MSKVFIDSFREFVISSRIPFIEDGLRFSFPLNDLTILLCPGLKNLQLKSVTMIEGCPLVLNETRSNGIATDKSIKGLKDILYLYEDRWFYNREMVELRILARLNRFRSIFARKCKIIFSYQQDTCNRQMINNPSLDAKASENSISSSKRKKRGSSYNNALDIKIREFIERYHPYGYARSKFRLALEYEGEIVAAAAFSASRPMPRSFMELTMEFKALAYGKNGLEESSFKTTASDRLTTESERLINKSGILTTESERLIDKSGILATDGKIADKYLFDSYEWVRYISLPGVRVVGGMGKLLNAFVNSVTILGAARPIEVMSYSDNEWSAGEAYKRLGFTEVAYREPVTYYIEKKSFERLSYRKLLTKISRQDCLAVGKNMQITDTKRFAEIVSNNYYEIKNRGSRKFLLQKMPLGIAK